MTARDYFRHIADELTGILGSAGEGEGAARTVSYTHLTLPTILLV